MSHEDLFKPPPGTSGIPANKLDRRTDEEIAAWLQRRHEVVSEKNHNVVNWVRRLGPDWTVHVLDTVPDSETNVRHFIEDIETVLPKAFNEGTMNGPTVGQHQADLVRSPLIYQHGGIWMDVGMILFRHVEDICWSAIMDPTSPYEVGEFAMQLRPGVESMMNGFIAARKGNLFIERWHTLPQAPIIEANPAAKAAEQLNAPEATVSMAFLGDYLMQILCFERLRRVIDPNGFNGPEYYATHVFLLPSMSEMYYLQGISSWQGDKEFALLSARATDDSDDVSLRKEARRVVDHMLANTATMKLSHAPPGELPFLADIQSQPEYRNADLAKGTFAAYLRHSSVHFDQGRKIVPMEVGIDIDNALRTGLLKHAATEGTTH
ncbi:hypothetical protein PCL_07423 [Purpureocillium lilacinum]|uniref:Capsule polysaccharide biosynthesis protein n=1 Tax=Purpureocillium lilacinum TaxID=33203 RepID=A0A2U3DSA4_PURLI|nr:hypothetical protein PCL_07423 [Purpureocillium lilacinum]